MRIRHKRNACLNCGYRLNSEIYNYCPSCGQENTDTNISFGRLFVDFLSNVFALDSRYVNSFGPFFIKPGYLTNRFNEGKRASYASPVRLYLIISLFFFFALGLAGKKFSEEFEKGRASFENTSLAPAFSGDVALPDSLAQQLNDIPLHELQLTAEDNAAVTSDSIRNTDSSSGAFLWFSKENWSIYSRLKDNRRISDNMIFDSLKLDKSSPAEKFLVRQIIRIERADSQTVVDFITKNLPLLMFLMLPVFALLIKLLYIRRSILYIRHLIHSIHLHCFAYIIYGVTILILLSDFSNDSIESWAITLSIALVTVYSYISFLRVYGQSWFKTLVKFLMLGWFYSFCLAFGVLAEMIISFLLY